MSSSIEDIEDLEVKKPLHAKGSALTANFDYETYIPSSQYAGIQKDEAVIRQIVRAMIAKNDYNKMHFSSEFKLVPNNVELYKQYVMMVKEGIIPRSNSAEHALRGKSVRTNSGVNVFTVVLSDKPFGRNTTCEYDCSYCPAEPDVSRSYLKGEPAVHRGFDENWDPAAQIIARFMQYLDQGNISAFDKEICKAEVIIEGGTLTSYPREYIELFIRLLVWRCNTAYDKLATLRAPLSLEEELRINETVQGIRIIGMSVETRPDTINGPFMRWIRWMGVTKVQLGVQHLDDNVLRYVNRGCYLRHTYSAMKQLLDAGFKIQIHMMPDLPSSSPELDMLMFWKLCTDFNLYADHWKVYPCMVLDYTKIKEWFNLPVGHPKKYVPYASDNNLLMRVLLYMTKVMRLNNMYFVRIERVIRDIPKYSILGGCNNISMGADLTDACKLLGETCICIRCREMRDSVIDENDCELVRRDRPACGGTEVFLSFENRARTRIYALLRLRLTDTPHVEFPELVNAAFIREIHVYGKVTAVNNAVGVGAQHRGFGSQLIEYAETIAYENGKSYVTVIPGPGVMGYYRNHHEFYNHGLYMRKTINVAKQSLASCCRRQMMSWQRTIYGWFANCRKLDHID